MWKAGVAALMTAAAVFVPSLAQADAFEDGMNTMWEVLWHQSGMPTRLVRWEQDLQVRVHGQDAAGYRQQVLQALRSVAAETGRKVVDVSDRPDQPANVRVEIVADGALSDNQPCETRLDFRTETVLDSVTMQMRASEVRRCAHHEAMHVMGVRGHPEGDTVLSYFTPKVDRLSPLDKAMLRAWYSPRARGGMTPFELLPILADELVAILPDRRQAMASRDRFLARTVTQMREFADGRGDVPAIVTRSGKSTELGVKYGRMEMSYFLGIAYLEGTTVAKDEGQAAHWLQRAASLGSRTAQARLGAAGASLAGR